METLFVGQNTIFLPETESTNSYAVSLLKNVNAFEGTVVYSTHQTHGRGQRGNTWLSEKGANIAFSVILKPTFIPIKHTYLMYILSALAVYDVLTQLPDSSHFDIKIKWPNDILVNGKKVAGILNETVIQNNRLSAAVIGIGLNINQTNFANLRHAGSLKSLFGKNFEIKPILEMLCVHLEKNYIQLKNGHATDLTNTYLKHFYKHHQWQAFRIQNRDALYLVNGISEEGLLHLQDKAGNNLFFDVKEIQWLI